MSEFNFRRKAALVSVILSLCMLTSCSGSVESSGISSSASTSSCVSTASSATSDTVHSTTPQDAAAEPTIESEQTEEPVVSCESVTMEETEQADAEETGFPTEDIPAEVTVASTAPETEEQPVVTTAATTTTPAAATAITTVATDPPEPPKPPAEVVIPEVMSAEAPGTLAAKSDNAVIDYSNISLGYIAASYSGSSGRAKLRIICGDITYDHDVATGGRVEFFPLSQGSGEYSVQIYEQIEGRSYSPVFSEPVTFSASIKDDVEMYLYPNKYVSFVQGSDCVRKGAELCAGADGTIEKLAAIFGYVTDSITYDFDLAATVKSGYVPEPDTVLKKGKGICFDYAALFAAMARSQGIPTRLVIGYSSEVYHAWNEVYTKETGWISAELLLSRSGYNIVDSTFYAGAADKAAMAEYITNSANYSAVFRY